MKEMPVQDDISRLWAIAGDVETLQQQLDATQLALREAVTTVLAEGRCSVADVSEASGLSEAELLRLMEASRKDSTA